jgi:hypothetical protein
MLFLGGRRWRNACTRALLNGMHPNMEVLRLGAVVRAYFSRKWTIAPLPSNTERVEADV